MGYFFHFKYYHGSLGGTTFNVTVAVPAGTVEATYELAVLIIGENKEGRDEEFARLNSNVVVKAHIEEVVDVEVCLTDIFVSSEVCLPPGEFDITIEAYRIQTASIGFLIENRGNVDVNIALS